MKAFDVVVVGAGIVGLTIARAAAQRGSGSILVLEKEPALGCHASGRNSGVLHSGIYYPAQSMKAKVCAQGARRMYEYALAAGVSVRRTDKVIVAATPALAGQIDVLYARAQANGAQVEIIDSAQLRKIEPDAATCLRALYSPNTAVVDSVGVLEALRKEIISMGAQVIMPAGVCRVDASARTVWTAREEFGYGHLINAAGLNADRIAHQLGVGRHYRILPFKGIYRKLTATAAPRIRGSIYPVPNPAMPFLGVHLTRTVDDEVIVGPTAIPAFGRENYGLLDGLDCRDFPLIARDLLVMFLRNHDGFRSLVREELPKYLDSGFLKCIRTLAPSLNQGDVQPGIAKVGIRPQLVDARAMRLVMDFVMEDGPHSTHILNAISPAFTASLAFADLVLDHILSKKE